MGCWQPPSYPEREMIHSDEPPLPGESRAGRRWRESLVEISPATRRYRPALARLVLQLVLLSLPALVGARCPLQAAADNFALTQALDFSYSCSLPMPSRPMPSRPMPMTGKVAMR
ncbi:hypothetical protein C5L14_18270 [Labrys okinawensis]|uniref:Uncharacterized protein n=2 Tax=Labrys okinawensis TaxID=346911 RepID=A0A2S9QA53_9HYPH|nr:hypothetical protein C5L14_18270 [Labrys okinawensis]